MQLLTNLMTLWVTFIKISQMADTEFLDLPYLQEKKGNFGNF